MPYLPSERRPPSRRNGISLPSSPSLFALQSSTSSLRPNQTGRPATGRVTWKSDGFSKPIYLWRACSLALSLSYAPRRHRRRCFERRLDSSAQPRRHPTRYERRGGRGREALSARGSFRSGVPEAPLLKRRPSLVSGLSLLLGSALRGYGRRGERGSKRAATGIGRSSVAKKPPDMTNRVIAFVCLLGVSGALGQAQDFAQQTSDYYRGKRTGIPLEGKQCNQTI